jgi:5-methylcytosine-specific restriction protein A
LIVFTISNRGIWIALDKERLKKDQVSLTDLKQWRWDMDDYPEYSVITSKNGFYSPTDYLRVWSILKKYHFDYIKKAAQKYEWLNIRSQKKHSSEFLNYLRDFLNCDVPEPNYNNPINDLEEYKMSYSGLSETERETVVQSRVGQGRFRNNLINYWKGCAVTGCKIISLLRASHIKPWRDCNNEERLDTYSRNFKW